MGLSAPCKVLTYPRAARMESLISSRNKKTSGLTPIATSSVACKGATTYCPVARSESTNSAPVERIHLMLTKRRHQLASSSCSCWRSTKLRLAGTDSGLCIITEPVTILAIQRRLFLWSFASKSAPSAISGSLLDLRYRIGANQLARSCSWV